MKREIPFIIINLLILILLFIVNGPLYSIMFIPKSNYTSSDSDLNKTLELAEFHIQVEVSQNSEKHIYEIDVDQIDNIHRIVNDGILNYVADYNQNELTIGENTISLKMAKVTDIFALLEQASKEKVDSNHLRYTIPQEIFTRYLLDTSVNIMNSGTYTYPVAEEDIVVDVEMNNQYIGKLEYKLNDISVQYLFSQYNELEKPAYDKELLATDLPASYQMALNQVKYLYVFPTK